MPHDDATTRRWLLVGALALAPAVSNGFARFAYGLILPAMRIDLGWNYTQAGWINTANALGYLIGALLALTLISRVGSRRMFAGGMLLTALALLFSGMTRDFLFLTVWRVLAGVGGAPAFIAGGAMVSAVFRGQPLRSALAIALYFGGGGIGMLISGASIPLVLDGAVHSWPMVWRGMGLASLATMGPVIWAVLSVSPVDGGPSKIRPARLPWRAMSLELIAYFLFAVGYIVYLTFVVAWMREGQASAVLIASMWSLIGFMVMASPILWRGILARYSGGTPMALACTATGVGTLLPIFVPGPMGALASAFVFGGCFFMGPASVTAFGRNNLPEAQWGSSIALFTTIFAVGQLIGPVAAGYISDLTSDLTLGLIIAGATLILAGALAAFQKPLTAR
ncbi:putative MFS family arabinose efflux permease [Amorphus suaedae]